MCLFYTVIAKTTITAVAIGKSIHNNIFISIHPVRIQSPASSVLRWHHVMIRRWCGRLFHGQRCSRGGGRTGRGGLQQGHRSRTHRCRRRSGHGRQLTHVQHALCPWTHHHLVESQRRRIVANIVIVHFLLLLL